MTLRDRLRKQKEAQRNQAKEMRVLAAQWSKEGKVKITNLT